MALETGPEINKSLSMCSHPVTEIRNRY